MESLDVEVIDLSAIQTLSIEYACVCAQSCPTVCDPMDCGPTTVHGIFQARIPEWVAISYSRGSFQPGLEPTSLESPALAGEFFITAPPGKLMCLMHKQMGVPLTAPLPAPTIHFPPDIPQDQPWWNAHHNSNVLSVFSIPAMKVQDELENVSLL